MALEIGPFVFDVWVVEENSCSCQDVIPIYHGRKNVIAPISHSWNARNSKNSSKV